MRPSGVREMSRLGGMNLRLAEEVRTPRRQEFSPKSYRTVMEAKVPTPSGTDGRALPKRGRCGGVGYRASTPPRIRGKQ